MRESRILRALLSILGVAITVGGSVMSWVPLIDYRLSFTRFMETAFLSTLLILGALILLRTSADRTRLWKAAHWSLGFVATFHAAFVLSTVVPVLVPIGCGTVAAALAAVLLRPQFEVDIGPGMTLSSAGASHTPPINSNGGSPSWLSARRKFVLKAALLSLALSAMLLTLPLEVEGLDILSVYESLIFIVSATLLVAILISSPEGTEFTAASAGCFAAMTVLAGDILATSKLNWMPGTLNATGFAAFLVPLLGRTVDSRAGKSNGNSRR